MFKINVVFVFDQQKILWNFMEVEDAMWILGKFFVTTISFMLKKILKGICEIEYPFLGYEKINYIVRFFLF